MEPTVVAHAQPIPPPAAGAFFATEHFELHALGASAPLPDGCDLAVPLPDGSRVAYVPLPRAPGEARELAPHVTLRGNAFKPLFESARTLAATLSIAASRRVETGPESDRIFVVLRGPGMAFLESGETHRFEPPAVAFVAAGTPARVWAQGPDDVLAVAIQPKGQRAERRTLGGEIARRRAEGLQG